MLNFTYHLASLGILYFETATCKSQYLIAEIAEYYDNGDTW